MLKDKKDVSWQKVKDAKNEGWWTLPPEFYMNTYKKIIASTNVRRIRGITVIKYPR